MIGHLYIPVIDNTKNLATSLSYNNVTKLLREELQYKGITFTDALEMQGVKKFFPDGEASVQSLIAGNDLLCLPGDIPSSIAKIKKAIKKKKLSWDDLNSRVHRMLMAKYLYGLAELKPIDTNNLADDLNAKADAFRKRIAAQSTTLIKNDHSLLPLSAAALSFMDRTKKTKHKIAYVAIGTTTANAITQKMQDELKALQTRLGITFVFVTHAQSEALALSDRIAVMFDGKIMGFRDPETTDERDLGLMMAGMAGEAA